MWRVSLGTVTFPIFTSYSRLIIPAICLRGRRLQHLIATCSHELSFLVQPDLFVLFRVIFLYSVL